MRSVTRLWETLSKLPRLNEKKAGKAPLRGTTAKKDPGVKGISRMLKKATRKPAKAGKWLRIRDVTISGTGAGREEWPSDTILELVNPFAPAGPGTGIHKGNGSIQLGDHGSSSAC